MLRKDLSPEKIKKLAEAGASLSRQLTMPFSGEKIAVCLNVDKFGGVIGHLIIIAVGTGLLDYADGGGLNHIYLTQDDQNTWDVKRWTKEIKKTMTGGTK